MIAVFTLGFIIGFILGAATMLICIALCSASRNGELDEPMDIEDDKDLREDEK